MENYNITEAFKALDEVAEIELQDLEPKKSIFSINDEEDVEELKSLLDIDEIEEEDPIEMIIDIDAEDEEELKDTYVGDVILQCNVCKSLLYKPEDQLVKDETVEDQDVYNVEEECPHCHKLLGYTLIGKVAPYDKEESEELQAEGEAGEDFEDEVFNSTESEPAEDEEFKEEEEVEVKKESLGEDSKQEVLNESCKNEEDCNEACEEAMFDNVKFDKEVFGKYFDEDGHLIPELEKEYWKAVEDHRKEKEVITDKDLKESDKPAAQSIEDAQKWVDYDMKKYGHISDKTNDLVKKAGFQIIKDDHGDYEVAAGKYESCEENLSEDTVKQDGKWVNKGKEGTHGKFKTKKEADAQRRAMFANGYKGESLGEAKEVFAIKRKNIENGEEKVIEVERVDDADLAQKKADEIEGAWVEKIEEKCKGESCDEACKEECEEACEESLVIENIDEELFDKLVNNYIKEVYDNIDSYTTTGGSVDNKNNKVVLEGVIKFKSGKEQNTKFIFEEAKLTKKGKLKLKGINETFAKMKKAFTLQGSLKDQNLLAESFTYNYKVNSNNEVRRIYGTERIPMNEDLKLITDFSEYEPWAGAEATYRKISDAGMLDVFEQTMEDTYPDGLTVTELNDILWFDGDDILEMLGLKDEEIVEESLNERFEEYKVIDKDGNEIKEGDEITDFRGDKSIFLDITKVPGGPSNGKIYVKKRDSDWKQEYYPSVFNLKIVKREEVEEACQKEECELKEGSKEIDRIGFKSLIKYDDPVFAGASHGVLNDGNFVEKFWADSDEEAIKKFRGEVDESCKEELEDKTDFAMDHKVDKVFKELQDLAIEAKEKGEDYTADKLLDASMVLDDMKITEECKDEACELKEEADLPAEIIDEIHDTVDYFFSPDFKDILSEDDWKDFILTLLNEPAISEEGIANSFEECSGDLRALLDTDKEPLIYEEAKRYLGTKMAELEEDCKKESCEEELKDDHHMRSELADVASDLLDLSIEARDKGEEKTAKKILDAVDDLDQENLMESEVKEDLDVNDQAKLDQIVSDHLEDAVYEAEVDHELDIHKSDMEKAEDSFNDDFFFGESLQEDINSVVINQGEEDEIKLEADDIKEVEVKEEDGKKVIEVEQEQSLEDLDAEPYLSNVEDEIEAEFSKGEVAPVEAPVEMIAPVEDEEAVSDEEAAAEIEAEFNQE